MKKLLALLFGLCLSLAIFAQAVPATAPVPRVAFPRTNVGNVSTLGPMTANAANAANFSFGVAANGSVFANTGDRLPTAGGGSIPLAVGGEVSKANVAKAAGRFMSRIFTPLAVADAALDLAKELGLTWRFDKPLNQTIFEGNTPSEYCPGPTQSTMTSAAETCQLNGGPVGWRPPVVSQTACTYSYDCGGPNVYQAGTSPKLTGVQKRDLDEAALRDIVAAKSGWPSTSALARTVADALKAGEAVQVDPKTVTGPASAPGPQASINNGTATSTSTTTNNYTYAGPNITTTNSTVTTVINNSTGAATSTTETAKPVISEAAITCGLPDTPACRIDETGVPDGSALKQDAAKDSYDGLRDLIASPSTKLPQMPTLSWNFALPSGCAVIPLTAFEPYVKPIDICQFQPMFHSLMSVVWMLGGLFGAISFFFKSALAD